MFAKRECAVVKSNPAVNIQWPVQTGVPDVYYITVKFYYSYKKEIKVKLQIIGTGNTMILDRGVSFIFTRPGKWK
jgi:hypothetical protein